jgi:hypothetical protein
MPVLNSKKFVDSGKFAASDRMRGEVLVEALVALSIITVGLLGAFSLISKSMALNKLVSERHIATYLAAEGIELVKNLIDANVIGNDPWNQGLAAGDYEISYNDSQLSSFQDRFLNYDGSTGFYNYVSGIHSKYKRTITISYFDSERMQVNSIVTWEGKSDIGARTVNLEDRFFNWR